MHGGPAGARGRGRRAWRRRWRSRRRSRGWRRRRGRRRGRRTSPSSWSWSVADCRAWAVAMSSFAAAPGSGHIPHVLSLVPVCSVAQVGAMPRYPRVPSRKCETTGGWPLQSSGRVRNVLVPERGKLGNGGVGPCRSGTLAMLYLDDARKRQFHVAPMLEMMDRLDRCRYAAPSTATSSCSSSSCAYPPRPTPVVSLEAHCVRP